MTIANDKLRMKAPIVARGTFTTQTDKEKFPTGYCNEIMGGPFICDSIQEVRNISIDRLLVGCKVTVNAHTDLSGKFNRAKTYRLYQLPTEDLVGEWDVSQYWTPDTELGGSEEVFYQYSDNYLDSIPLYKSVDIAEQAYQAGYATTEGYLTLNQSLKIWKDVYNPLSNKWVRQKNGLTGEWGIPQSLSDSSAYEDGQYIDFRFKWVPKGTAVTSPSFFVNGIANNSPSGWSDTPAVPGEIDYLVYILTNDLYQIYATKNVYGILKNYWSRPEIISADPLLVRYGNLPGNQEYLNTTYWRPNFTLGDTHKATRINATTNDWSITKLTRESGEYTDFIFKDFDEGYEVTLSDVPQGKPKGSNDATGWQDTIFKVAEGKILYVSSCIRYNNDEQKTNYSIPIRFDGQSTIRTEITTSGPDIFKKTSSLGETVVTPNEIVLDLNLYVGNNEILKSATDLSKFDITWYQDNVAIPLIGSDVLVSANKKTVTIKPNGVLNISTFSVKVVYLNKEYRDTYTIKDLVDSPTIVADIDSPEGVIFKAGSSFTYTANLYDGGAEISSGLTYQWKLNGTTLGTAKTQVINDTDIIGISKLEVTITKNSINYKDTLTLTDISDGISIERGYSADTIMPTGNPDSHPLLWSSDSIGAVWAIDKVLGVWKSAYRIKGEKGDTSGGVQLTVYKKSVTGAAPSTPVKKTSGILIPNDWLQVPEDGNVGETIFGSSAIAMKKQTATSNDLTTDNWDVIGNWSAPFKVTYFAQDGVGTQGAAGNNGWSPVIALVTSSDGLGKVQKVIDWVGGSGTKPVSNVYISSSGFTTNHSAAINIKGDKGSTGPTGPTGVATESDFWDGAEVSYPLIFRSSGRNFTGTFSVRKAKSGLKYWKCKGNFNTPSTNDGVMRFSLSTFDSKFASVDKINYVVPVSWVKTNSSYIPVSDNWTHYDNRSSLIIDFQFSVFNIYFCHRGTSSWDDRYIGVSGTYL